MLTEWISCEMFSPQNKGREEGIQRVDIYCLEQGLTHIGHPIGIFLAIQLCKPQTQ